MSVWFSDKDCEDILIKIEVWTSKISGKDYPTLLIGDQRVSGPKVGPDSQIRGSFGCEAGDIENALRMHEAGLSGVNCE